MAKKKATANTVDEEKIKEAKRKVNDLLKGTGLEEPEETQPDVATAEMVSPVADEDKASRWLEQQLNALNQQVEEMENRILQLTQENNALKANGGVNALSKFDTGESEKQKVIELYKHFENVYTGRNKYNTPFKQVAFSNPQYRNGVLDMFLQTFPYLHDYVQYKHWG